MLFSLPPGTEMFHFPGFPPLALYIQARVTPHHGCRVPPFGHPRIQALSAAPRGLSRPDTSFIGSWYQGIHRAPLHTYHTDELIKIQNTTEQQSKKIRCSHPLSSSQTPRRTPDHTGNHQPHTRRCRRYSARPGPGPKKTHHTRGTRTTRSGLHCGCPFRTQQCARQTPRREPGCLRCFHP
jgi:hypothetical protein